MSGLLQRNVVNKLDRFQAFREPKRRPGDFASGRTDLKPENRPA
jgi:hypothetical protein